jgi:hypothetical protein
MAIPEKKADLEAFGYVFDNKAKCRGCGAEIEWWITPRGKKMPMSVQIVRETGSPISPVKEYRRVPHWSDCPNAKDFRK